MKGVKVIVSKSGKTNCGSGFSRGHERKNLG